MITMISTSKKIFVKETSSYITQIIDDGLLLEVSKIFLSHIEHSIIEIQNRFQNILGYVFVFATQGCKPE